MIFYWLWKKEDCPHSIQFSGLFDIREGFEILDDIGAMYEDVETMGTLGGPLCTWGMVSDFSFWQESRWFITSIRITPFLEEYFYPVDKHIPTFRPWLQKLGIKFRFIPEQFPMTQSSWERFHKLIKNNEPYELKG